MGRVGRPLTTFMVLMVVLGIIAWAIGMVWRNVLAPVISFVNIGSPENLGDTFLVLVLATFMVVLGSAMFLVAAAGMATVMIVALRMGVDKLQSSRNRRVRREIDRILQEVLRVESVPDEARAHLSALREVAQTEQTPNCLKRLWFKLVDRDS